MDEMKLLFWGSINDIVSLKVYKCDQDFFLYIN